MHCPPKRGGLVNDTIGFVVNGQVRPLFLYVSLLVMQFHIALDEQCMEVVPSPPLCNRCESRQGLCNCSISWANPQ